MSAVARLSVMMFLQFFTWGAWFVTLGACLGAHKLEGFTGQAYGTAPIAAIVAPLFLGLIADRFFPSQIVMGLLMLIGGGLLWLVPQYAEAGDTRMLYALILGHMLCYMPTLGLSNTIAFTNIEDQSKFPKIRVWGTIGWIAAGLVVGFKEWSASYNIFYLGAICSVALGVYCFTLPNTPPPAKGKPMDMRSLFMVDAFQLLRNPSFFVFILCSTLICIPLAYYYGYASMYLSQIGFKQPASTMTLGQMSEIFFMLLIPFFFRRLGVKWMILVGMAAWILRYLLFAFGAPDQVAWMILAAVILHGVCYDFFFVTGFMYADSKAPKEVRGQAQSLLVFFTQGVGMFFGYWVAGARFGASVPSYPKLEEAFKVASTPQDVTFVQKFQQMFSVARPESLDADLLRETMHQWREFWLLPAGMAAAVLIIFLAAFHDRETSKPIEIDDAA